MTLNNPVYAVTLIFIAAWCSAEFYNPLPSRPEIS